LLFAIVGVFEEIVQAWTWLHSTPAMAQNYNSSRQRETGTAALSADMGRRMNPIQWQCRANPSPCVGLDWRGFQNQTEPFSLRGGALGRRGYHTWCEPCLLGLAMEAKILPKRGVRTAVEGSLKAPGGGSSSVPTPSERESHKDFAVLPCRDNIPSLSASPIDPRLATKVRSTGRRWSQ
jgi:hypothetical protein